jgi:hypothetical protein
VGSLDPVDGPSGQSGLLTDLSECSLALSIELQVVHIGGTTRSSVAAYLVRFHRPRDLPVFCVRLAWLAWRSWRVGGPPGPGIWCRPPIVPAVSRGRQWDLSAQVSR